VVLAVVGLVESLILPPRADNLAEHERMGLDKLRAIAPSRKKRMSTTMEVVPLTLLELAGSIDLLHKCC
jgi:hypothetical protein